MNFWQLILPLSRKALTGRSIESLEAGESTCRDETQILNKKGEERSLDVTVGAFLMNGRLAALIAAIDITDRKRQTSRVRYLVE